MERYFKPLKPARSSPSPTAALAQPAKRARPASDSDSSAAGGSSSSSAASGSSSSTPLKVVTWNCNGLSSRLASDQDLGSFVRFVRREAPDVILLQEVRMAAAGPPGAKPGDGQPRHRGKVHVGSGKKGREDSQLLDKAFHGFAAPLADYRPYLSLADKKYAGSAALVSRKLKPLSVRYRLGVDGDDDGGGAGGGVAAAGEHDPEGRVLLLEFQHWQLLATYTPNNGVSPSSFERRRRWDAALTSFVRRAHERATVSKTVGPPH
jgi:exonuclease III